jgi:hypothetical protein
MQLRGIEVKSVLDSFKSWLNIAVLRKKMKSLYTKFSMNIVSGVYIPRLHVDKAISTRKKTHMMNEEKCVE